MTEATTAVKKTRRVKNKAFFPIKGKGWCGPTALNAVLGVNRDKVRRHVAERRGHCQPGVVRGMYNSEMRDAAYKLTGRMFWDQKIEGGLTLKQWRELPEVERMFDDGWKAIVEVTGHYIAMAKSLALDTSHGNEPHHYLSSPYLRSKAKRVFWVRPTKK